METDLNKIPLPDNNVNLEQVELKPSTEPMLHEGLHTEEDFQRIRDKKAAGEEPWVSAYQLLVESQFSQKTADTYPTEWIKRPYQSFIMYSIWFGGRPNSGRYYNSRCRIF